MIPLSSHNPSWKTDFQLEKTNLFNLGLSNIVKIEHIGSTAIPGIVSKPVIDILIGVNNLNTFTPNHIQQIESLGYRYNPRYEAELPFRRYFQKENAQGIRTHQIHLVNYPSQWYEKHLLFRDFLLCHNHYAQKYETLKLELSRQFDNTLDYAKAKTIFCQNIDEKAFFDFNVNHPFMETERLFAFIPQLACHMDYAKMLQDKQFCKAYGVSYTPDEALLRLKSDMDHWNQYAFAPFTWYEKENYTYVGRGGLKFFRKADNQKFEIELTYQVSRNYWNQGFASEMGEACLEYAFKILNLDNVICFTAYNNHSSLQVMQKLGFVFEEDFIHAGCIHKLHRLAKGS